MAEAQHLVDIDPEFEPLSRPRSCTWPLPRPEFLTPGDSNTSSPVPSVKQEPPSDFIQNLSLLEESEDFGEGGLYLQEPPQSSQQQQQSQPQPQQLHLHQPQHQPQSQRKSSSSRRNAWGNMSYADLITKAIESSPESRLTLSQIYDWMVKSVPYFKDKGDSNSSAGWKNSIRHNLSLHSRFVRVQNEGTGKSSWWMLNPEGGKSGKSPRRRAASMDNNSKFSKSRGRAAKKKMSLQGGPDGGGDSPGSFSKWPGSPNSHSNDDFDSWNSFRPRASSNASTLSGRLSPFVPEDDLGEAEVHMGYPGPPTTLPSLSEMTGSLGHGGDSVMENLLDNLNLLSPNNSQVVVGGGASATPGSSQSSPSPMMQQSPVYPAYTSPSPQDFRKCAYGQAGMGSLPPLGLQSVPEAKPAFGGAGGGAMGQYGCTAGLLKELLTSDTDQHGDIINEQAMLPPYSSTQHKISCLPHPHPPHPPHSMSSPPTPHPGHNMSPAPSPRPPHPPHNNTSKLSMTAAPAPPSMNGRMLMSLNHTLSQTLSQTRLPSSALKSPMHLPYSLHHSGAGGGLPGNYCPLNTNGYSRPPPPAHPEKLPSDLDDMSIERFEFDMETVLHDTLMDGDALDFNFDPAVVQQAFNHGAKTTTHSWVSG